MGKRLAASGACPPSNGSGTVDSSDYQNRLHIPAGFDDYP